MVSTLSFGSQLSLFEPYFRYQRHIFRLHRLNASTGVIVYPQRIIQKLDLLPLPRSIVGIKERKIQENFEIFAEKSFSVPVKSPTPKYGKPKL